MSSVESLNSMPRRAVSERDPQAWSATLAAAQRVMRYHASKAEAGQALRIDVEASVGFLRQRTTDSRLAA